MITEGWEMFKEAVEAAGTGDLLRGARSQTSNSWSFIYFTLIFH